MKLAVTAKRPQSFKRRLAKARKALDSVELKILEGRVDELKAVAASRVSPAKLTAPDGSVEAVVIFGSWLRDQAAGEEGPGIGYRVGSSMPAVTLLINNAEDEVLPDLSAGDHIRLRRIGKNRHAFLGVVRPAAKRQRIDWLSGWRSSNLPTIQATDEDFRYRHEEDVERPIPAFVKTLEHVAFAALPEA